MAWILGDTVKECEKIKELSNGKEAALSVLVISPEKFSGRWGLVLCMTALLISQSFWYDDWRITTREIPKARVSQRAVLETIGTDKEHVYLAKAVPYQRSYVTDLLIPCRKIFWIICIGSADGNAELRGL